LAVGVAVALGVGVAVAIGIFVAVVKGVGVATGIFVMVTVAPGEAAGRNVGSFCLAAGISVVDKAVATAYSSAALRRASSPLAAACCSSSVGGLGGCVGGMLPGDISTVAGVFASVALPGAGVAPAESAAGREQPAPRSEPVRISVIASFFMIKRPAREAFPSATWERDTKLTKWW
jgi:hypothetical protein